MNSDRGSQKQALTHGLSNENARIEYNAELDLNAHLDMVAASYFQEMAGDYLECIKERHFKNGALFNNFLLNHNVNESCFLVFKKNNYQFTNAVEDNFKLRDSFGNFTTTFSATNSDITRISADASDNIDALVQVSQLHFSCLLMHNRDELIAHVKPKPEMTLPEEIIVAGLLMAIKNGRHRLSEMTDHQESLLMDGMKSFLKYSIHLLGRKSYQAINQYVHDRGNSQTICNENNTIKSAMSIT